MERSAERKVSDQMHWSNPIVDGTVSGVISGLLVAFTLGVIERSSRPRLELRQINNDTALLRNNGFRAVALGDTYALEKGTDLLFPKDGFRGHISEMRYKARDEIIVGCTIDLGESVSLTYKPIWTDSPLYNRYWRHIQRQAQQADVMTVLGRKSKPWWTKDGIQARLVKSAKTDCDEPVRLCGWKLMHLPLKPM